MGTVVERVRHEKLCVCMQHNDANTIIYKTPVDDMDFQCLSAKRFKINFRKYSSEHSTSRRSFFAATRIRHEH